METLTPGPVLVKRTETSQVHQFLLKYHTPTVHQYRCVQQYHLNIILFSCYTAYIIKWTSLFINNISINTINSFIYVFISYLTVFELKVSVHVLEED